MNPLDELFKRMKEHPGFYFGGGEERRSIFYISAFVMGFGLGREFPQRLAPFGHFTRWVAAHYRVWDESNDGFSLILQHVGGDERLAFDEFFRLYPAYAKEMRELGPDAIHARYTEAMAQIPEDT
jgi:hypothetical protein